jgi:CDP-diacylglycerol---serine O-phosphatidyltransferase
VTPVEQSTPPLNQFRDDVRFAVPQVVTGSRAVLGAFGLFFAARNELQTAAACMMLGAITDFLDGYLANRLHVQSDFGYLFDCFTDYFFYIAVPTFLAFQLAAAPRSMFLIAALAVPFVAGASRYARNIGWSRRESFDEHGFPGLPTLIYAFYIVALVLLWRRAGPPPYASTLLCTSVPLLSVLMVSRVRYPKLSSRPWLLGSILLGINAAPFVGDTQLPAAMLALGGLYVVFSPLALLRKEARCPLPPKPSKRSPFGLSRGA